MFAPRYSLLLAAAFLAAACARSAQEPRQAASATAPPAPTAQATPPEGRPPSRGPAVPQPSWPVDWKLLEKGATGPDSLPLTWYRFEAPSACEPAARQALEAIRAFAGSLSIEDVAVAASEQKVIAQFRGARLSGAIEAVPHGAGAEVRITLEPAP